MTDTDKTKKLTLKSRSDASAAKLEERLHKVLAQAGLGSRRSLEQRIADGLVKVNGEVATVGMSVRSGDKVELDGRQFVCTHLVEPTRALVYNKPEGEVTTREDPEGRPTVFDALPSLKGARWIAIGRLDINTTGLLLLTTDGELANALMHPSFEVEREYICRVRAPEGQDHVGDNIVDRLRRGVSLDDGPAKFDTIERIGDAEGESHDWFQVSVKEGRNREVRRLWESQGCQVSRLKRVRYGAIHLPRELRRGHSSELDAATVKSLRESLGLTDSQPSALTLQPVIGQRRATKSVIQFDTGERRRQSNHEESSELRRFDSFRDDRGGDRGRGRGGPKHGGNFSGGLTVSGDAAAKQSTKPFKQRREKGPKLPEGSPAAFRSWYVPDGVDTGPGRSDRGERGPRGPGGRGGPGAPSGRGGPGAPGGRGGPRSGGPGGGARRDGRAGPGGGNRGPGAGSGPSQGQRRPGGFDPRGGDASQGRGGAGGGQRDRMPYGHPGNAPTFPSDYADGGYNSNYGDRPRAPRGPNAGGPRGNRGGPGGGRNAGPGGNRGPGGGSRGPGGGSRGPGGGSRGPGGGSRGPRGGGGNQGGNGGGTPWGNR